jgi:hypothetical protein
MLICSNEFAKGYLWKYVDVTINKAEFCFLKNNTRYNTQFEELFKTFCQVFTDISDMYNYLFVISIVEPVLLKSFLIFYSTNIQRIYNNVNFKKIETIDGLVDYIREDEHKFKVLLISLYYYF